MDNYNSNYNRDFEILRSTAEKPQAEFLLSFLEISYDRVTVMPQTNQLGQLHESIIRHRFVSQRVSY